MYVADGHVSRERAKMVPPPTMGAAKEGFNPVADAPGSYVLQK